MINKILFDIDDIIIAIKAKDNTQSFNMTGLMKFEFILFLTLDIVRYELICNSELTDLTSDAVSQLFVFQCFEFYYRDFSEIYSKSSNLFASLNECNARLKNNDLKGSIGVESSHWIFYFNEVLTKLIAADK
jgi:hypothetical protein